MIKVIPGELPSHYPRLIDEMHRLRRNLFHERLRWQVPVINRWEVDGYDALDPLYVLATDEREEVLGSLRLLPTTGFNMLNDTFPELLPDGQRIESPLIWEASRFAVRITGDRRADGATISRVTAEFGLALNEIGKAAGLTHIVAVYDAVMHRLLSRSACAGEPLGTPRLIGGTETYAVLFEVGPELDAPLRRSAGSAGVILDLHCGTVLRHPAALAEAAKSRAGAGRGSMRSCSAACSSLTFAGVLYPCRPTSQVSL